jgi:hypothetical protein
MPGADFGDEFGAAVGNMFEKVVDFTARELAERSRGKIGQLVKRTVNDVADGKRRAEKDAADLRDALENGPNERFDFTNDVDQVITFDLSDFQDTAHEVAKQHLEGLLKAYGLNPYDLVPQYMDILQDDGTRRSIPNGKYDFTFRDDQARVITEVTGSYYNAALADPRVMESLGLEGMNVHVSGLESIGQRERESLLKYLPEIMDVPEEAISVARDGAGQIESVSAFVEKGAVHKAIESFNRNKGKLNLLDPKHDISRKLAVELSTEDAPSRKEVLAGRRREAEMLSRDLIANGALNTTVHVSPDGTIYYRAPMSELGTIERTANRFEGIREMREARGAAAARRPADAIPAWKETKARAIKATEAEQKLATQYLDPSRIRESLPKVPIPTR